MIVITNGIGEGAELAANEGGVGVEVQRASHAVQQESGAELQRHQDGSFGAKSHSCRVCVCDPHPQPLQWLTRRDLRRSGEGAGGVHRLWNGARIVLGFHGKQEQS